MSDGYTGGASVKHTYHGRITFSDVRPRLMEGGTRKGRIPSPQAGVVRARPVACRECDWSGTYAQAADHVCRRTPPCRGCPACHGGPVVASGC